MPSLWNVSLLLGAILPAALAAPFASNYTLQDDVIPGKYIVTLKADSDDPKVESHLHWVEDVHRRSLSKRSTIGVQSTFNATDWHGYYGEFDEDTIKEIEASPEVAFIEPDHKVYLQGDEDDDKVYLWEQPGQLSKRGLTTQQGAPWGLGAISHREFGADGYTYDTSAGAESYAYVVDSGVQINHYEFEGRAIAGHSVFPGPHADYTGHGTHVAGIIAGKTYGVAKNAQIVSVKVFQGPESATSAILEGFNWAVNDIISKNLAGRSVINLSLGGPASYAWTAAIDSAYRAGILVVVAAGNGDEHGNPLPASSVSPANARNALTVGAINFGWNPTSFTNYGPEVDIMAPGEHIESAGIGFPNAVTTKSGTSMACPHVAGLALYLQVKENLDSPDAVYNRIKAIGTSGRISGNLNGNPNLVAFNGARE